MPGFEGTPFLDGVATFGNVAGLVADFIDQMRRRQHAQLLLAHKMTHMREQIGAGHAPPRGPASVMQNSALASTRLLEADS